MRKKYYEQEAAGLVVRLEASRNWSYQALFWLFDAVFALVVQDFSAFGAAPPTRLVVREKDTGTILHIEGPYHGSKAVQAADEAARVIRSLGLAAYIRRESLP